MRAAFVLRSVLLVAAALRAQDGLAPPGSDLRDAQELILRGDLAAARAALDLRIGANGGAPGLPFAKLALLRAAAEEPARRAAAFVGVAEAFGEEPEADVALVGALAALGGAEDVFLPLFPSEDFPTFPIPTATPAETQALLPRIRAALLRRATATRRDDEALADARRRFDGLTVVRFDPRRVRPGAEIRVPAPLAEPVRVVVRPIANPFDDDDASAGSPIFEAEIDAGAEERVLPALPAGAYVVEVAALSGRRRATRRLLVSDVELTAIAYPGAVVVAALRGGVPAAGVEITCGAESARTDVAGLATLPLLRNGARIVRARFGAEAAAVRVQDAGRPRQDESGTLPRAHVICDRARYAPGDSVRGRVLLREVRTESVAALGGSAETAAALVVPRSRPIDVVLFPHTDREIVVSGTTDADGVFAFVVPLDPGAPIGRARMQVVLRRRDDERPQRERLVVYDERPCVVVDAAPPFVVEADCPVLWRPGDQDPLWRATVRRADGAPAAGLHGDFKATYGSYSETVPLILDHEGRAAVRVPLSEIPTDVLRRETAAFWSVEFHGPYGAPSLAGSITFDEARIDPVVASKLRVKRDGEAPLVAGGPLALALGGPPNAVVVLVVGRAAPLAAIVVRLDGDGRGRAVIDLPPSAWPRVRIDAAIAGAEGDESRVEVELDLLPEDGALEVRSSAEGAPRSDGPETEIEFSLRDRFGKPRAGTLAVLLTTSDAARAFVAPMEDAFRPALFTAAPSASLSEAAAASRIPVAEFFVNGRILESAPYVGGRGGGSFLMRSREFGPRGPEASSPTPIWFAPSVRTDAEGRATLRFPTPSAPGPWRVLALAADDGRAAGRLDFDWASARPAIRLPATPEFLREGDVIEFASSPSVPPVRASAGLREESAPARFRATDAGVATIESTPSDDAVGAPVLRASWPVLPSTVRRVEVGAAYFPAGRGEIAPPPGFDAPGAELSECRIYDEEIGLRTAALRRLAARAEEGAVDAAAAFLAASLMDAEDPERGRTADRAARRLRSLRTEDGYAERPGMRTDFIGTPEILRLLALARDFGLDAHRFDATPDLRAGFYAVAATALHTSGGDPASALQGALIRGAGDATEDNRRAIARFFADDVGRPREEVLLDFVLAAARFDPARLEPREAIRSFVRRTGERRGSDLLRAADALAAASLPEEAKNAFDAVRLKNGAPRLAEFLLSMGALNLSEADEIRPWLRAVARAALVPTPDSRPDATARALAALAMDARRFPQAPRKARSVRIEGGGGSVVLTLDPSGEGVADATALARLVPAGASLRIEAEDRAGLAVVWTRRLEEDSAAARSFGAAPQLRVRLATDDRTPAAAAPSDGVWEIPQWATIEIEAPEGVLDAPDPPLIEIALFAGAEILAAPEGADRIEGAVRLPRRPRAAGATRTLRLRAAFAGEFVWPGASTYDADALHVLGRDGGLKLRVRASANGGAIPPAAATSALDAARRDAALESIVAEVGRFLGAPNFQGTAGALDRFARFPSDRRAALAAERLLPLALRRGDDVESVRALLSVAGAAGDALFAPGVLDRMETGDLAFLDDALTDAATRNGLVERAANAPLESTGAEHELGLRLLLRGGAPASTTAVAERLRFLEARAAGAVPPARLRVFAAAAARELRAALVPVRAPDGVASRTEACEAVEAELAEFVDRIAARVADSSDAMETRGMRLALSVDVLPALTDDVVQGGVRGPGPRLARAVERLRDAATDLLVQEIREGAPPDGLQLLVAGGAARRAERLLSALLETSGRPDVEDPRFVRAVYSSLALLRSARPDGVGPDDGAAEIILNLLGRRSGVFAEEAFRAASPALRAALPSAVPAEAVAEGRGDARFWIEALLAREGGALVVQALLQRDLDPTAADAAIRGLSETATLRPLGESSLEALLRHRPRLSFRSAEAVDRELAERAGTTPEPLAAALAQIRERSARHALAAALGDAGVSDAPFDGDDEAAPILGAALRVRAGDLGAADRLRARLSVGQDSPRDRSLEAEAERVRWLDHLAGALVPDDVIRFGAPLRSARRESRIASWGDAEIRAVLAAADVDANPDPPPESAAEPRGAILDLLAVLPPERRDGLRSDLTAWFRRVRPNMGAADLTTAFSTMGAAQLDVLQDLLASPPLPPGGARPEATVAARRSIIEALDRRPAILAAAEAVVRASADEDAEIAFAGVRLESEGRSTTVLRADGRTIVVAPEDEAARAAALAARLRAEGPAAASGLGADLRAAWNAALRARGLRL